MILRSVSIISRSSRKGGVLFPRLARGGGGVNTREPFLGHGLRSRSCSVRSSSSSAFRPPPAASVVHHRQHHPTSMRIRQSRSENHSTAAATAFVSEELEVIDNNNDELLVENDQEDATTTNKQVRVEKHAAAAATSNKSKPRLEALRVQLRKDPAPTSFLESSPSQQQQQHEPQTIHWKELLRRPQKQEKIQQQVVNGQGSAAAAIPMQELELEEEEQWPQPLPPQEMAAPSTVLTDRFGRHHNYLRISLAERCNLRCTYCMPPEGVPLQPQSNLLQTDEILLLAKHFQNHGVNKIRLTGGEPTLRKDLVQILEGLRDMKSNNPRKGFDELAITTNGVTLAKNLESYVNAGLNRVNISLDTLHPEKFATLTRRPASYYYKVWEAIEVAATQYTTDELVTKINVVVMKGINDDEIRQFCNLQQSFPNLHIRFIEYMPFTENGWNMDKWVPYRDLLQQLQHQPNDDGLELVRLPESDPNDTTKWYTTLENHEKQQQQQQQQHLRGGGSAPTPIIGKIGFITSMSQPFCGTCNRLRLTSDGQIKVCLFDGNSTISLRDAIREGANPQDLDLLIQHALQKKHFSLGGHTSPEHILQDSDSNRPMTLIGG